MLLNNLVGRLSTLRALVIGDICLDRWCMYDPGLTHASLETGLDRIAVTSVECTPGGGGTVANNLAALGLRRVAVVGAVGEDGHGHELCDALCRNGIEADALLRSEDVYTFTYTKLINVTSGVEDQPRVDFVNAHPIPPAVIAAICDRLQSIQSDFDLIVIADQAELPVGGVVTEQVREVLAQIGGENPAKVLWADSRLRCELFRNVTVKVNRGEAVAACRRAFGDPDYGRLRRLIGAPALFVTDGPNGTVVESEGERIHIATQPVEQPVDICGAGDSFSAGAACALALGAGVAEAAELGNLVASVTIMKRGTGTATPEELLHRSLELTAT